MSKTMKAYVVFLTLSMIFISGNLSAEVFKWVDESGRTHYSDKVKDNQVTQAIKAEVNIYKDVPINYSFTGSLERSGNRVIMYSASWCGYCTKARKYFKSQNISFDEYDIEKNKKAKLKYDRLGGQGVPLILVGKKSMRGFSVSGFNDIYK